MGGCLRLNTPPGRGASRRKTGNSSGSGVRSSRWLHALRWPRGGRWAASAARIQGRRLSLIHI
eukprot:12513706-Alexandrium_andersonii.AAC.1